MKQLKQKVIGLIIILVSLFIFLSKRSDISNSISTVSRWEKFEIMVRDGVLKEQEGKKILEKIILLLDTQYRKKIKSTTTWTFPLEGYDYNVMDKNNFLPNIVYGPYGVKGYNFFDGNRHGGHPAYDIFIRDKNQDCLNDITKLPVNILSMVDCVVLSTNSGWEKGSKIRGGNYIWCYSPSEKKFFYYAHLNQIFVSPGQIIKQGEKIGTVGRSGFLAEKESSPTHLHLMVLEYKNGEMVPYDFYEKIKIRRKK